MWHTCTYGHAHLFGVWHRNGLGSAHQLLFLPGVMVMGLGFTGWGSRFTHSAVQGSVLCHSLPCRATCVCVRCPRITMQGQCIWRGQGSSALHSPVCAGVGGLASRQPRQPTYMYVCLYMPGWQIKPSLGRASPPRHPPTQDASQRVPNWVGTTCGLKQMVFAISCIFM